MSKPAGQFQIHVEQVDRYEFRVRFDREHFPELRMDEPPPLGRDAAPNPARVLAAAVGDCLSASLLFCLQKAGHCLAGLGADVDVAMVRNKNNRLRIGKIDVKLQPRLPPGTPAEAVAGCLERFEDFCVVTQSVRQGIEVAVQVDWASEPAAAVVQQA